MASISTPRNEEGAGQHLERLRADFATLSETVKRLSSESAASVQSQVSNAVNGATRGGRSASHQIHKDAATLGHDAVNTASAASDQIQTQIARNPVTVVLVALGVGFVIGLLSRQRSVDGRRIP